MGTYQTSRKQALCKYRNSFLLSAIKANTDLWLWLFKHVSSNQRSLRSLCLWFNWINACCRYNTSRRQFSEIGRIQTRIEQRRNRADIDLKHNENEWHEENEQWKWILRNSVFDWRLLQKFFWLKFLWEIWLRKNRLINRNFANYVEINN